MRIILATFLLLNLRNCWIELILRKKIKLRTCDAFELISFEIVGLRTTGPLDQWTVGLLDLRINGHLDYWTVTRSCARLFYKSFNNFLGPVIQKRWMFDWRKHFVRYRLTVTGCLSIKYPLIILLWSVIVLNEIYKWIS